MSKKYNYARELGRGFNKQFKEDGYTFEERIIISNKNFREIVKIIRENSHKI